MRVGELEIVPLRDGTFTAPDGYFGADADVTAHADLLDADGRLRLPIGCFLVRTGDRTVLIDAGLGRVRDELFEGGHLLDELAALDVRPGDIDLVVCSHLHLDHCGWLADKEAVPVFPRALVCVGTADWRLFVERREGVMRRSIREALVGLAEADRVRTLDGDVTVAPGITAVAAPGHTPGHTCIVVSSGHERALLLGDAITCPVQLEETDWSAMSDVDPGLAAATRERLWRELEGDGTVGVGAHFPELQFGRVLTGSGRRWWS